MPLIDLALIANTHVAIVNHMDGPPVSHSTLSMSSRYCSFGNRVSLVISFVVITQVSQVTATRNLVAGGARVLLLAGLWGWGRRTGHHLKRLLLLLELLFLAHHLLNPLSVLIPIGSYVRQVRIRCAGVAPGGSPAIWLILLWGRIQPTNLAHAIHLCLHNIINIIISYKLTFTKVSIIPFIIYK